MRQNHFFLIISIYFFAATIVFADTNDFPKGPDAELTPGVICVKGDSVRYPEHIQYCARDVSGREKWLVINRYARKFHFIINDANRTEFKIDHYIPLCMGGANDISNLWPQHSSIYRITDSLEEALCEAMSLGKLLQKDAIQKMKQGKNDLSTVPAIMNELQKLKEL